jgi:hypothetical protein
MTPPPANAAEIREGSAAHFDAKNLAYLRSLAKRNAWIQRMKPKWLASRLGALLLSGERRRVVGTRMGIRLYLDPLSHLGQQILRRGVYEPETYAIVRSRLRPGDVFVDVGPMKVSIPRWLASSWGSEGW